MIGLEDQCVAAIAALYGGHEPGRGDLPAAIALIAEHCRKACVAVEIRQAQEVDRTVAGNHGRRATVTDQGIVRDRRGHASAFRSSASKRLSAAMKRRRPSEPPKHRLETVVSMGTKPSLSPSADQT